MSQKLDSLSKIIIATGQINYMANSISTVNEQIKFIPGTDCICHIDEMVSQVPFEIIIQGMDDCELDYKKLKLQHRNWTCGKCNTTHDRDANAATNIKNFGLRYKPVQANAAQ